MKQCTSAAGVGRNELVKKTLSKGFTMVASHWREENNILLVPLGSLSPAKAAPLSDAALTPYHAIKRALPSLNGESAVILGVGGLGHMAIQILRVMAPVTIIAADVDDKTLQQAKTLGADHVVNNRNADEAAEAI